VAIQNGYVPKQIKEILVEIWGVTNSAEIPADKFDEVIRYFASCGQDKPQKPYQATDEDLPF